VADRIATLGLHVGRPREARAAWQSAINPPRPALVASRVGMTYLVEDRPAAAVEHFERAASQEPRLFEAWYGLAVAEQDLGRADATARAAARAVEAAPTDLARTAARTLQRLAEPYAEGSPGIPPPPVSEAVTP
jgi:tetratricopeptide (TPR) repeat protein